METSLNNFSAGIKKSIGGDEYYTQKYEVDIIVPFLKKRGFKKIWCPFDTVNSEFVKTLGLSGFSVYNGHISSGHDFFWKCLRLMQKPL